MQCGHCAAVCPADAVRVEQVYFPELVVTVNGQSFESGQQFDFGTVVLPDSGTNNNAFGPAHSGNAGEATIPDAADYWNQVDPDNMPGSLVYSDNSDATGVVTIDVGSGVAVILSSPSVA